MYYVLVNFGKNILYMLIYESQFQYLAKGMNPNWSDDLFQLCNPYIFTNLRWVFLLQQLVKRNCYHLRELSGVCPVLPFSFVLPLMWVKCEQVFSKFKIYQVVISF